MGEVAGESPEKQIAKFNAAGTVAESQWEIAHDSYLWLNDGQTSSFLRPGSLEVSLCQLITEIGVTIERMQEINVKCMGPIVSELFFETFDHVETKLVIEPMRSC